MFKSNLSNRGLMGHDEKYVGLMLTLTVALITTINGCVSSEVKVYYTIVSEHGAVIGINNSTAVETVLFKFSRAVDIDLKVFDLNGTWQTLATNMSYSGKTRIHEIDIYVLVPGNISSEKPEVRFYYKVHVKNGPLITGTCTLPVKVATDMDTMREYRMHSGEKIIEKGSFTL